MDHEALRRSPTNRARLATLLGRDNPRLRDRSGQIFKGQSKFSGITARPAAVYPIAILFGRCVGEMLPWSSPENIGRLF